MTVRFIKFIPSDEASFLRSHHPFAFLLLNLIAERARRVSDHIDGLLIGDAMIGDHKAIGATRQQYRSALQKLVDLNIIEIIWNGKKFLKREKSTIKTTIKGTLVNLKDSSIWDINSDSLNQHINQRPTNSQPTANHEQERRRSIKKEEEVIERTTTTKRQEIGGGGGFYDCLKELDIPVHRKVKLTNDFPLIRVELAMRFIQHEDFVPTKGILQALVWHCKQINPPEHAEKPKPKWKILALQHNEIYRIPHKKGFERNLELIKEQKMYIWQIDSFVPISLGNNIEILKKDFEQAVKEYNIALKNWKKRQIKIEKLENYA